MSSPPSEATSTSDVSIISQWQDVLGLPVELSQRLSGNEDFRMVVQHLNDYIATNNTSTEEYEHAVQELTETVEERNRTSQTQACEIENLRIQLSTQSIVVEELSKEKNELESEVQMLQGEVESKSALILTVQSQLEDANERLKPVPSIPGDRETLLRLLDRRQQEIDHLTAEWRSMLDKLEAANADKSNTQSKLDEIVLQDSSTKLREQLFEQEKKLLQSQNEWLNTELNSKTEALLKLQKDRAQQVSVLECESLKLKEEVKQLTSLLETARKSKSDVEGRLEELRGVVSKGQEESMHIEEQFRKEISAQSKLVELYKNSCEEAERRVQELVAAVERQQKLLEATGEEKRAAEERLANFEATNSSTVQELNEKVDSLTVELEKANDLILSTSKSSPISQQQLAEIFPAAAATSGLLKSGMTLTQIYSKYAEVSDELIKEKEAKELVQNQLNYLIQELQDRTPILQKQRENLDQVMEENKVLKSRYENVVEECEMLRLEADDASRQSKLQETENDRLKKLVADLSKQVKVLLQECEEARGGSGDGSHDPGIASHDISSGDVSSSSEVISGHLVSFRNIDELQEQNQRLLMVIRDLSGQQEQREQEMMDENHLRLKEQLKEALDELGRLREARERQKEMVKAIVNQRDMYQRLLAQATPLPAADEDNIVSDGATMAAGRSPQPDGTVTELKELRERFEDYRKERLENEKILRVQVEEYREEASKLRLDNATIISKLEFAQERLKNIQSDCQDLKHENSLLKEREKVLSSSLDKYENKNRDLIHELLTVRTKLSTAEANCNSLRAEKQLISQAEVRATQLYQSLLKEQQNQNLVLVNLQTIQNNMERSESQTRAKLEAQITSSERELALVKKKLEHEEEERDKRRQAWEQRLEAVQSLLETEKSNHEECKDQLKLTKNQLSQATEQLATNSSELERHKQQLKEKEEHLKRLEEDPRGELQKKIRILEKKLADATARTTGLESELSAAKQNAEQYQLAAQANEEALRDLNTAKEQYEEQMNKTTAELEEKKKELVSQVQLLQEQANDLQSQLTSQQDESNAQVTKLVERISELELELTGCRGKIASLEEQQCSVNTIIEEHVVEKKKYKEAYDRELVQHGNTMQELVMVKQRLETEQESLAEADEAVKVAEAKLAANDDAWKQQLLSVETENQKVAEKYQELLSQNERLHGQAEQLTAQLKVLQRQSQDDDDAASIVSGISSAEKTAEELWDIIRYIRREKQISDTKMELAQSQKIRLQELCDHLQRKLTETEKMLTEERERNTMSMKSAEEHATILAKVEQLNLLSDSNKLLREQKNKLEQQLEASTSHAHKLEVEVQPLKENIKLLTVQKDALVAEKTALKNEVAKWNTRTTQLIERYNQVDPDEYKQLMEERETRKQEVVELKAQIESLRSELNSEQEARQKLESEIASINSARESEKTTAEGETKELQEKLAKSEEELAKANEAVKSKTIVVQKLQKLGRSYRMKYEESSKELEELKESSQSKEAATAAVSASQQSELEKKIKELEKENKEQKETVESQKASITVGETKMAEMRRTMKIAMQRIQDMKTEREKLDREMKKIGEERAANEQQLEELTKKLDAQKTEYEERISSLEERLRHYHHSPKPEGRLTESAATTMQIPSTQSATLATPMATVKPTTSVKYSASTRVSVTPTASIRPLASTTQTPTAAVTPTLIAATNTYSSQQQACVAPIAPVTTVTTESVTTMDTGSTSTPVSSVTMATSGEVPTTTATTIEVPVASTISVVEPTTSLVASVEASHTSRDSSALLQEPQEPQSSSRESSVAPLTQQDSQAVIQPPAALKHVKPSAPISSGNLTVSVPTVSIVKIKHPGLSSVGAHPSRVIKRQRVEEDSSTNQEESSGDSKKLKREVTATEETAGSIVSTEDVAMSSTAGEMTEEEQTSKEPTIDHDKEEDSMATMSVVSETTTESSRATVMPIENVPVSSVEPQHQQQQTNTEAEDKEAVAEPEVLEQMQEQEEGGDDDEMVAISESAATSEVIVDDDDDDDVDDEAEDMADEPEEETMEEVVEEEEEGEGDEEADDDDDDDVDIEGFETAATDQNMEEDVGMSKSDPIELSSDEETERIPPVMLSSTVRDTHIKLEQPDDEGNSIVLRMVDEITDASSSIIDIGGEVAGELHADSRDEAGDMEQYSVPLQMPLSDNLLPTTRDNAELPTEIHPQVEVPRHVRPQTMATRPQPTSLHEVTSDRLVPHTPVYGDPTLLGFPSVPTSDQPRLVGCSQLTSSTQVAMVPSLEVGDMLLTAVSTAAQSVRNEPVPEPTPPTVVIEPPVSEDQSTDHVSQQDDHVTTTTAAAAVVQAHVSSTEVWSPEEGELEDIAEEDTLKVTVDSDDESSIKSVTKVSLVGESASGSEMKDVTKESDQASGEESSSVRRLVGSSSGTQESTAAAKGSGITEQSDQKAVASKRKIRPVVWDKGSQSGSSGSSLTATTGATGRGTKIKRLGGDAPRRGRGGGRGQRKTGGAKK